MANVDVRKAVLDLIRPLVPRSWVLSPTLVNTTPSKVTVELALQSIRRLPDAPQNIREVEYQVTVIAPKEGSAGWDAADDAIIDFTNALDDIPNIRWTETVAGSWNGSNPCFLTTITFPFEKLTKE